MYLEYNNSANILYTSLELFTYIFTILEILITIVSSQPYKANPSCLPNLGRLV